MPDVPTVGEQLRQRCEDIVDLALEKNPVVRRLVAAMSAAGCKVPRSGIQCIDCSVTSEGGIPRQGGYDPEKGGVSLCYDTLKNARMAELTLAHELVHAHDAAVFGYAQQGTRTADEFSRVLACTEIRAASLSGDCSFRSELERGNTFPISARHRACVRRRAVLSLEGQAY